MLTAKEMQELLQVDRSTVYRMAEAGRLPAVKVGKQWRFPAAQVENWLKEQAVRPKPNPASSGMPSIESSSEDGFVSLLPVACVQLIQDTFADALGAMLVITDMQGRPVTEVSKPCGLFQAVNQFPNAVQKCIEDWATMGEALVLEPRFTRSHLGLLGARGLIKVGTQLQGMVILGGIAPDSWPPSPDDVTSLAAEFNLPPEEFDPHLSEVFYLSESQKLLALSLVQRIADIITHIIAERVALVGKLNSIAQVVMR